MRSRCLAPWLLLIATGPVAAAEPIAAGVAGIDITPGYPIRLHGYAVRKAESAGVQQRIRAKALAIGSDEQGAALLISVDSLGVSDAIVSEVAGRLKAKAGLARERFAVASSHTHSAPCLTDVAPNIFGAPVPADQQAAIDRYTRELTDKLEQVGLAALKDRQPARLAWGQGKVDFALNRRTKGGPVDHALPMLRVADPDGKVRAVVVGYACHCTTLDPADNLISGDWAGYAQEAIESECPGALALTVIGCGGDANPEGRTSLDAAKRHGRAIADEVARVFKTGLTPLDAPPRCRFRRVEVPFDTLPTHEELEKLVKAGGAPGGNAAIQLGKLDRGEPLQAALDYPVQTWQFGDDLAMVFLAGEVVVDYSLRLKTELDPGRLWVVAYANDVPSYIPSERILREGGYEGGGAMVYYARPTRLRPGVEDRIIRSVRDLVPDQFDPGKKDSPRGVQKAGGGGSDQAVKASLPPGSPPALSPEEGLRSLRVKPGLRAELVASEPLIVDPVAIDFGADGKLWVCEMHDYPTGLDGNWKPGGRIKFLEDVDGDGHYDKATTFLEGVPFPTWVMAWRRGVLVCAAPEIFYAEDADGDGKADVRKALFTGFSTENYQARVNGLAYNLDNWVYGANGLIGGAIRGLASGKTVDIGGRDFRIRPDTGAMEPASGLTQQGRAHDDWGEQFGGNNSVLIQHYPLPDHYARRNPRVAAPSPSVYVPRDDDSARLFPASRTIDRFNHPESANRVTSACSPSIYRDDLIGDQYKGNAFICEPVHNLVHREVLTRDGVTFDGHRAGDEQQSEFLASTDNWFRPVQVRTGPDGALYVVDMYRFVIEHPRWISPERLAQLDVRAGADKGRIYRLVPEEGKARPIPNLEKMGSAELASLLDSPNGELRDMVQRVLVHRGGREAVPALAKLAETCDRPEGRMQALCTLDGLGALSADQVRRALRDAHPGVRRQAVRLAESRLKDDADLGAALLELVKEDDPGVRFQLALTLGEWDDPRAGEALGKLATSGGGDPWIRAAVLTSAARRPGEILAAILDANPGDRAALIEPLIATLAGSGDGGDLGPVIDRIAKLDDTEAKGRPASWRLAALAGLLDAISGRAFPWDRGSLPRLLDASRRLARDGEAGPGDRAVAIRLLGRKDSDRAADLELLGELLTPREPTQVQLAAVRALGRLKGEEAARTLLAGWGALGPETRREILERLLSQRAGVEALLAAVERGELKPREIDAAHRQRLLQRDEPALKRRAAEALASALPADRAAVLETYRNTVARPGNSARGSAVFDRICAACHKLGSRGHEVGPDLAALTDTSAEALLIAILDPNREVDARYASYAAELDDGRVVTGLMAGETGNAITLKRQEGGVDTILRSELVALKNTGQSLMPEGLESDLSPGDVADLIAYLGEGGAPAKSFPGNHPETVAQAEDGSIRLSAATASVRGPNLVFEPEFGNLGYWHSEADRADWSFRVDRPGTFTVAIDWACADESAGNAFEIRCAGRSVGGVVGGTGEGTWANYRSEFVAEIDLPAGEHRLEFRPAGPPRGALLDLKAVVLTPRNDGAGAKP